VIVASCDHGCHFFFQQVYQVESKNMPKHLLQKIKNVTLLFPCFLLLHLEFKWSRVVVEQLHHGETTRWIPTFVSSAALTELSYHWKMQPSNSCNSISISFVIHRIIILYNSCLAVCNFLFAQFAEGIHSITRILLCKQCKIYQPLFSKSSATHAQLSKLWMYWLPEGAYLALN